MRWLLPILLLLGCSRPKSSKDSSVTEDTSFARLTLNEQIQKKLWAVFADKLTESAELSIVWHEHPSQNNDYLIPILQILQPQSNIFHKRIRYVKDTAEMQFTWLGRPRTVTSHRSLEYITWSPEYVKQVSRWMKQDEIWFITSMDSPPPPKSVQQDNYTIDCIGLPVLTDYRVTKCTRLNQTISSIEPTQQVVPQ